VNYLLDTTAVVALLRNRPAGVRERYRKAEKSGDYPAVSSVVLFGLWYGVEKSGRVQENTERLRVLLSRDLDLLDFDDEDAQTAGRVGAARRRQSLFWRPPPVPDQAGRPVPRGQAPQN
jgi:tRNA(fMet)-specific endonuclease VapC